MNKTTDKLIALDVNNVTGIIANHEPEHTISISKNTLKVLLERHVELDRLDVGITKVTNETTKRSLDVLWIGKKSAKIGYIIAPIIDDDTNDK